MPATELVVTSVGKVDDKELPVQKQSTVLKIT
jgi:hypothetical protein